MTHDSKPGPLRRLIRFLTHDDKYDEPQADSATDEPDDLFSLPIEEATALARAMPRGELLRRVGAEAFKGAARLEVVTRDSAGTIIGTRQGTGMDDTGNIGDQGFSAKAAFQMAANNVPDSILLWYASQGFPGFQILALLAQHWLVQKACAMPARDAVRKGYTIKLDSVDELDPDKTAKIISKIAKRDRNFKMAKQMQSFVTMGRVFGIRIAMYIVDGIDYAAPFNPDGVRPNSYKGIVQIDPYWCAPELSAQASGNPSAQDFYEPTWWVINGQRVHRTHLCIFLGDEVADVLKPTYLFAGISIPQKIFARVYAAERTADEAPQLTLTKRTRTVKLDMAQAIAKQGQLQARLLLRAQTMDNYGTDIVDKNDTVEFHDTALSDLDAVIMSQFQLVAAIAEVPATKLLGTTPKGFNSSGDYEQDSYIETLESIQANDMEPLLAGHHLRLVRSEIAPEFGVAPFGVDVIWTPLETLSKAEMAEVQLKKAQTAQAYAGIGAIDGQDVREQLSNDEDSGYANLRPIEDPADLDITDTDPNGIEETTTRPIEA